MERVLDAIERGGNKMPHPAILFLCALRRRDRALAGARTGLDVKATYEVVEAAAGRRSRRSYYGGSTQPVEVGLPEPRRRRRASTRSSTETAKVQGLLTADGIRFLFTSFVANFRNFTAMAIILVVMIGVGLAEASGLIASLIRKLVAVSSAATLTYIIVFLGIISSIASDAGYLVLIPLGAAAFKSVGRNPLAGHGGRVRRRRRAASASTS